MPNRSIRRTRALVGDCCERNNLLEWELFETILQRCARRFRRITSAPELIGKPPANLNARRKMRIEVRPVQAHEANELGNARNLNRPQPKTVAPRLGAFA